ncbi:hypothetical protein [Pedobacter sp.]|uniref:hypothetical protein n=1 Tax=Pedobacter sp. TaxID=1411316 RepID=UPI002CF772E8|nr:hypothetical protein [Pedobacter sp.]HWW41501.1 hypothetical protein [Pedobacter sp.]
MKLFGILFLGLVREGVAQQFQRKPNESAKAFIERIKPNGSDLNCEVLETPYWNNKMVVIAWYILDANSSIPNHEVVGYVYVPVAAEGKYQKVFIDSFQDDNVETKIASVFFANADQDAAREMLVITNCEHRLQYLYEGTEFTTSVYDDINFNTTPTKLKRLDKIGDQLSGGLNGYSDAQGKVKAKLTDAAAVRKELRKLGY